MSHVNEESKVSYPGLYKERGLFSKKTGGQKPPPESKHGLLSLKVQFNFPNFCPEFYNIKVSL